MARTRKGVEGLTRSSRIFKGRRGVVGKLTFSDVSTIVNLLRKYKGAVPKGFIRGDRNACVGKGV